MMRSLVLVIASPALVGVGPLNVSSAVLTYSLQVQMSIELAFLPCKSACKTPSIVPERWLRRDTIYKLGTMEQHSQHYYFPRHFTRFLFVLGHDINLQDY